MKKLLYSDTQKLRCEGRNANLWLNNFYFHQTQTVHVELRLKYKTLQQNKGLLYTFVSIKI